MTHHRAECRIVYNTNVYKIFSAKLLYPYWQKHGKQDNPYLRQTKICCFRENEQSPWKLMILAENDRFNEDALHGNKDFEQRYFKYLNGNPENFNFREGPTAKETADNAYELVLSSYPQKNQNVPKDAEKVFKESFITAFTNNNFQEGFDTGMLPSQKRAKNKIKNTIIKDSLSEAQIYNVSESYIKIMFDDTTFHIHKVGDNLLLFADTKNFNSLNGGPLLLENDCFSAWETKIKEAWLMQQMHIILGEKFNPQKKPKRHSVINSIPLGIILGECSRLIHTPKNKEPATRPIKLDSYFNSIDLNKFTVDEIAISHVIIATITMLLFIAAAIAITLGSLGLAGIPFAVTLGIVGASAVSSLSIGISLFALGSVGIGSAVFLKYLLHEKLGGGHAENFLNKGLDIEETSSSEDSAPLSLQ